MKRNVFYILGLIWLLPLFTMGQDLDELLANEMLVGTNYESAAFKATRIINGHSVKQMQTRHLDFRISHRFGELSGGVYELFGLDQASTHLSLEYGLSDWLMLGLGRSSLLKTYDGFVMLRILRQTAGSNDVPIFLSYVGSTEITSSKWTNPDRDNKFSSRITYVHQLLIARKFNNKLSLQLSPTLVHKNLVPSTRDKNDLFALGFGGRYKVSNRVAITAEYYYAFRPEDASVSYPNSLSLGVDIETGGHVFQLLITNSLAMREGGFIWGENNGNWDEGGIHFGFNISRVFSFTKQNPY